MFVSPYLFYFAKICVAVLNYDAQTLLRVGMSRCPTRVGVQHLYDTRTTRVEKVKQVSFKKYFFFPFGYSLNWCRIRMTLIQHVSSNSDKVFQKYLFSTYLTYFLNMYLNNIINEKLKTLICIRELLTLLILDR